MTSQIVVINKTPGGYEVSNVQGADLVCYESWDKVYAVLDGCGYGPEFIAAQFALLTETGHIVIVPD